jgi:hypothetical protein
MPDEFSSWRRMHDRSPVKEPFVTKTRHIHRFGRPERINRAKREAERDRIIFLWIMAALVAIGIVVAVAAFIIHKETGLTNG